MFSLVKLNWDSTPLSEVEFTTITGKKIDLYKKYHTKGLEIIAIAMHYDPPNHVINLSEALQLPYDVALDLTGEIATVFGNVQLTPSTFLIGSDSLIDIKKVGAFDPEEIKTRIEILLKG
jgi:hypothetical protein